MGTSRSFRSPAVPRWQSVLAQIANAEPAEQVRAELFNAGRLDGWDTVLGAGAIAGPFVEALLDAHGTLGGRLRAERVELAIAQVAAGAREQALRGEGAPGVALAERALQRTLLRAARTEPIATTAGTEGAAEAFERARGSPAQLVQAYLVDILHQYICHVVARDAGQLIGRGEIAGAREVRALERRLAEDARRVAEQVVVAGPPGELSARWPALVREAFSKAAARPGGAHG
jgi:hypothetical protein